MARPENGAVIDYILLFIVWAAFTGWAMHNQPQLTMVPTYLVAFGFVVEWAHAYGGWRAVGVAVVMFWWAHSAMTASATAAV